MSLFSFTFRRMCGRIQMVDVTWCSRLVSKSCTKRSIWNWTIVFCVSSLITTSPITWQPTSKLSSRPYQLVRNHPQSAVRFVRGSLLWLDRRCTQLCSSSCNGNGRPAEVGQRFPHLSRCRHRNLLQLACLYVHGVHSNQFVSLVQGGMELLLKKGWSSRSK